jgi:FAD/FMN-containing dehydrogenase
MKNALKIIIFLGIIFGIYLVHEIIYLSTAPADKYECLNQLGPIFEPVLTDPLYPQHKFKTINDVSCQNLTRVYDIINVNSVDDIAKALEYAKKNNLHISASGSRHTMGGQAFYKDAIVLDMRSFNKILSLDEVNKTITVQSGATWHDIQLYLNKKNLAVKAMQSTNIFTVGGSLSVNAHGMDHRAGSIASTVKSFTMMMADGTIKNIDRENNLELFNLAIGGYGLFGIILEIKLEITDNIMLRQEIKRINLKQFINYFKQIQSDDSYALFYAHLSTSPLTFLDSVITYSYKKVNDYNEKLPDLRKVSLEKARRLLLNLSKKRWYGKVLKWVAEKYIDPLLMQIFKKSLVSRNEIMHDSVDYLANVIANEVDILQEYYVPEENLIEFINKMRQIFKKNKTIVLNLSIRFVHQEYIALNYAPKKMFAIVMYINQKLTPTGTKSINILTNELINLAIELNGTFFLPYQLIYNKEQLKKAYPNIDEFFSLKRKYDPENLFMNNFYAKYAK